MRRKKYLRFFFGYLFLSIFLAGLELLNVFPWQPQGWVEWVLWFLAVPPLALLTEYGITRLLYRK